MSLEESSTSPAETEFPPIRMQLSGAISDLDLLDRSLLFAEAVAGGILRSGNCDCAWSSRWDFTSK